MPTWNIRHTDGTEDTVEAAGVRIDSEDYMFFDERSFVWCAPRQFVLRAKLVQDAAAPSTPAAGA